MRTEHDFLGEMNVPDNVYYGVQTMRAMENFHITGEHLDPDFIQAMAIVKKAAALANMETGRLDKKIGNALVQAASEIIDGQWLDQFPVDPIQGGAGTSVNMNMNEVLCNRALEIIGKEKGRYDIISPNNHANMAQSTNDVFPTSIKVCLSMKGKKLTAALKELETELDVKADEFKDVIKMAFPSRLATKWALMLRLSPAAANVFPGPSKASMSSTWAARLSVRASMPNRPISKPLLRNFPC